MMRLVARPSATWRWNIALAATVCGSALALDATPAMQVTPLVKATTSWDGKPIAYPDGQTEISGVIVEIAPGAETGWHKHPVPSFGIILDGTLEVTLENGQKKSFGPGQAVVEVVDTLHNARNVGRSPVKIVVFYAGAVGQPLTVRP